MNILVSLSYPVTAVYNNNNIATYPRRSSYYARSS